MIFIEYNNATPFKKKHFLISENFLHHTFSKVFQQGKFSLPDLTNNSADTNVNKESRQLDILALPLGIAAGIFLGSILTPTTAKPTENWSGSSSSSGSATSVSGGGSGAPSTEDLV